MQNKQQKLKKKRVKKWSIARHIVQGFILLWFLSPLVLVEVEGENFFYGTLASSEIFGIPLTDPFAALQVTLASKQIQWGFLGGALIIFAFYALIKGRVFCSWVCPINTLLEMTDKIRNYIPLPDKPMDRHTKIYIAIITLILSFLIGIPVFEIISPIGNTMRSLVLTTTIGLLIVLAIVLYDLVVSRRGWCRYLCPLGGMYQSIGKLGLFRVKFDHNLCLGCDQCRSVCLSDPEILEPGINRITTYVNDADCNLCGKCVDNCPVEALSITLKKHDPIRVSSFQQLRKKYFEA
ncbi:NapH/MauN family ferredoxin-type protein [Calidifontibacillus oryziterrae]|uniref:NapH/MauN family ferredoxin-type protein n=1 Tax=Calidifontibacillus oryziterrae TaxID=1191699 RepID=UPI0003033BB4|nr:NapH/MauN family ferredoxin-type protein [Calidifontibacillus oryziterrae]